MPIYFSLHDADRFHEEVKPALSTAWRQRSFEPCRALCASLVVAAADYAQRYHTGEDEPLLRRVATGSLPFDRDLWRLLVGEVLLYSATEVPEVPTVIDTLTLLLTPGRTSHDRGSREGFTPLEQVHFGTRDLLLGGSVYRPDHAGYNDTDDVSRLASWLAKVREGFRETGAQETRPESHTSEEWRDEIEFVREEVVPALVEMYQRADTRKQIVVCEHV